MAVGERIDGETDKAYGAFVVYRDLGPERTLEKVRLKFGYNSARQAEEWSRLFAWQERVAAWDDELDSARRTTMIEEVKDLAAENARRLQEMGEALHVALLANVKARVLSDGSPNAAAVQWRDFPALAKLYVDALQLSQNKPTSIQGSTISAEQLDKILLSMADDERVKVVEGLRILQRAAG